MIKEERFQKVLAHLNENRFATVKDLSQKLNVSMPTVRRDLAELEMRREIVRSHGGARLAAQQENIALPIAFRRTTNVREKTAIAKKAMQLVQHNSVIFIDSSTTAACLADFLADVPDLIVVTSSLTTAMRLKNRGIRTYSLGGEVLPDTMSGVGPIAIEAVSNFNIDVMFFSSYGINAQGVIIESSEPDTELLRHVMKLCNTTVYLIDSTKYDRNAAFKLAPLSKIDYLITNVAPPQGFPAPRCEVILAE